MWNYPFTLHVRLNAGCKIGCQQLVTLRIKVIRFDYLKELYEEDEDFGRVWIQCQQTQFVMDGIHQQDGFLFQGNQLFIPRSSLREQVVWELHGRGLGDHMGRGKAIAFVDEQYYWPQLKRDVGNHVRKCPICQTIKGYLLLLIPLAP